MTPGFLATVSLSRRIPIEGRGVQAVVVFSAHDLRWILHDLVADDDHGSSIEVP
jgi:hypothetical protein